MTTFKKGALICVDSGEYSDYGVHGFFRAAKDFEFEPILEQYLKDYPKQKNDYEFHSSQFLAHMIKDGYIVELDYGTIYLGAYGRANSVQAEESGK